jgi:hypothetical protein
MELKGNGLNLVLIVGVFAMALGIITSMGGNGSTPTDTTGGAIRALNPSFISPTCTDSDGNSILTRGQVVYTYGSLSTIPNDLHTSYDYCDGDMIKEPYCFVNAEGIWAVGWHTTKCPGRCANGACVRLI